MTMTAPMRVAGGPLRLPQGVEMAAIWEGPDGNLVRGTVKMPVGQDHKLVGHLWLCQRDDCPTVTWMFGPDPNTRPEQRFCAAHGVELVPGVVDAGVPDPIAAARVVKSSRMQAVYQARRQRVVDAAQQRANEMRAAAEAAARQKMRDLRGHTPSAAVSAAGLMAGVWTTAVGGQMVAAATGAVVGSFGAVVAYLAVWAAEVWKARRDGVDMVGRKAARSRGRALHVASGFAALGVWLLVASVLGVDPATVGGSLSLLAGPALMWAVNRTHWEKLSGDRRRLAELARLKAEEAAKRAAEEAGRLAALANQPKPELDETDPVVVGQRMAAKWAQIAKDPNVPFRMDRTRIVPEETRPLTVPHPTGVKRIGWEFAIVAEPGVLVSRAGVGSPLIGAREWLASMLERDPATVSPVDPPSTPNRGALVLSDGLPLGEKVAWKGAAGIRRDNDGTLYGHIGRALTGEDVEEILYTPGQPSGGLTVGTSGGGKSAGMIVRLLNLLTAGIFPMLHDPKNFMDYIDFLGIFPMVALPEHRNVMLEALAAERVRREKFMTTRPRLDRHGRPRTGDPVWDTANGAPIRGIYDEFHMNARDDEFTAALTSHTRLQRASAVSVDILTQGGGLSDLGDSNLRDLVSKVRLTLYRVSDHLARLAGYEGEYSPALLPSLPGMCLMVAQGVPEIPMRSAFVTREDVDGSVYDTLYAPDGTLLLPAPAMPAETLEVWESVGLMDLWRMGQEENGLERLLSSTNGPDVAPAVAVATAVQGSKLLAADVILGIVASAPGCDRGFIDAHDAWVKAPGWSEPPVPSTVSNAARKLRSDKVLSKTDDGKDWRVLPKGEARAKAALAVLVACGAVKRAVPSAAEQERLSEVAAEQEQGAAQ